MSCRIIDNNAYELSITPSRKRKRESGGKLELPASADELIITAAPIAACFTNAAFSSTPKKLLAKRLLQRENLNPFLTNPCLEVKSILDIVQEQQQHQNETNKIEPKKCMQAVDNPYEVVRKPPKKKKKRIEIEEACFENPALNLELPEKQFNPFEVQREPAESTQTLGARKCFTNEALNLRGQDVPASRNPFEIPRCSAVSMSAANPDGVENMALETLAQPSNLQIRLPFTPTLGCRIDFKNLPLSQLTPSKLFAEKLVFSPVSMSIKKTPKRSLSSISEETMDIGKELDLYQLELENSINEAKLRKNTGSGDLVLVEHLEQKITFTQKLTEIVEQEEPPQQLNANQLLKTNTDELEQETINIIQNKQQTGTESLPLLAAIEAMAEDEPPNEANVPTPQPDVMYASDEDVEEELDDDLDFKAPAPFVRAYRRAEQPATLTVSKESLNSNKSDNKPDTSEPKKHYVKNMIRNSIRKLMHPQLTEKEKPTEDEIPDKPATAPTSIMSSIRHSLRRKPHKQLVEDEQETCIQKTADISIIDSSERTMKLKSNLMQTDYAKIEELTNEKKHSIRSSLRKSTREVRQQFMKTVFHKNQEVYAFRK